MLQQSSGDSAHARGSPARDLPSLLADTDTSIRRGLEQQASGERSSRSDDKTNARALDTDAPDGSTYPSQGLSAVHFGQKSQKEHHTENLRDTVFLRAEAIPEKQMKVPPHQGHPLQIHDQFSKTISSLRPFKQAAEFCSIATHSVGMLVSGEVTWAVCSAPIMLTKALYHPFLSMQAISIAQFIGQGFAVILLTVEVVFKYVWVRTYGAAYPAIQLSNFPCCKISRASQLCHACISFPLQSKSKIFTSLCRLTSITCSQRPVNGGMSLMPSSALLLSLPALWCCCGGL